MKYGWNPQAQFWNDTQPKNRKEALERRGYKVKVTKRKAWYLQKDYPYRAKFSDKPDVRKKVYLYTVWIWNPRKKNRRK